MKLEQLRQIVTIEKCKSISKAAKELYMGQPALSSSLSSLEKKVGVQIFQRTPQGVLPTEDGKKILETAHRILNECSIILDYSKQHNPEELTGTIKVSLAPGYSYLFFDILTRYKEKFPKVDFEISILPLAKTKEMLRRGEYSVAIDFVSDKIIEEEKFHSIRLKAHTTKLFAGPMHRFYERDVVDVTEVREEKFVAFSKSYWKENNKNLQIKTTPIFVEDNASIRQIIRKSDMIAIMPDVYDKLDVEEYKGRPRMIPITGIRNPAFYGNLVYPGNRQLTLLEQNTIEFLKKLMLELE
ncbi:MAG: LysR family transcriptional regulator [Lachnospiraceae bacterium]|nr:LysR family transcriptional regulator [Lachnospiraceae bacterium]